MSSKSRKSSQPSAQKARKPAEAAAEEDLYKREGAEEEFVRTPKEQSKVKYYLTLGCMLFVLLTFMSPFAVQQMFDMGGGHDVMRWTTPDGETVAYDSTDWFGEQERFNNTLSVLLGRGFNDLEEVQLASFLIYDRLALDAGIDIGADELQDQIDVLATRFGGLAGLAREVRGFDLSPAGFEDTLRRLLRGQRYQALLTKVASVQDVDEVERLFRVGHKEYTFDVVSVDVEAYADAAAQEVPDLDGLRAWFDELPEAEQNPFKDPETFDAQLFGYRAGDPAPQALLDAYPAPPPDPNALDPGAVFEEVQAKAYYDGNFYTRFVRETPLTEEEHPGDTAAERNFRTYLPYEEVQDVCMLEAPIHAAAERWRQDLVARMAELEEGETIDVLVEATDLGLAVLDDGVARSRTEWTELEVWGGTSLSALISFMPEGELTGRVLVTSGAICLAQLEAKFEPQLPEFETIVPDVEVAWAEARQVELASEALEALRDGFAVADADSGDADSGDADNGDADSGDADSGDADSGDADSGDQDTGEADSDDDDPANPDDGTADDETAEPPADPDPVAEADAFRAAAEAAGLTVVTVDWFDRQARAPTPPSDPEEEPTPEDAAENFVRTQPTLFVLDAGTVPAPIQSLDRTSWNLVRCGGERDGDVAKMGPRDYQGYRTQSERQRGQEFATGAFGGMMTLFAVADSQSIELRDRYDLYLRSEDPEVLRELEEAREDE